MPITADIRIRRTTTETGTQPSAASDAKVKLWINHKPKSFTEPKDWKL